MKKMIDTEDSTLTVRIDCRSCSAKCADCHRSCPQSRALESDGGRTVTRELIDKGRKARIHKDVNVTFGRFMTLVGEREAGTA